jgi:hypothetical protein
MGSTRLGIPEHTARYLKERMNLTVFVEGGTYRGATSRSMSNVYESVYTIEKSEIMYEIAKECLKGLDNVQLLKGDTRDHLDSILSVNDNILFWLDAHWSGDQTYGEKDECPLIEELQTIFSHDKDYVILVDDARLFLKPPPKPHNMHAWPSIVDIARATPDNFDILAHEDVLYFFPSTISDDFKGYIQEIETRLDQTNDKDSILRSIFNKLRDIVKGGSRS